MANRPVTQQDLDRLVDDIAFAMGWFDPREREQDLAEIRAEQAAELALERWYEDRNGAMDATWAENQADLALHDFLHPAGYGR